MTVYVNILQIAQNTQPISIFATVCFNESSSLHIYIAKPGLQFLNEPSCHKNCIYPAKFPNDIFCHCTNSLSSLHISINNCTFCESLHVKTSPDFGSGSAIAVDMTEAR